MISYPITANHDSSLGNDSTERKHTSTQTDSSPTSPTIGLKPPTESVTTQTSLSTVEFIRYVKATVSVNPQARVLLKMNDIITAINERLGFISKEIIPLKIILNKPPYDEAQEQRVHEISKKAALKKGLNIEANKRFTQALMDCAKDIQTEELSLLSKKEPQMTTEEAETALTKSRSKLGKLSATIRDETVTFINSSESNSVDENISSKLIQLFDVEHVSPENKKKLADSLIELINGGISNTSTETPYTNRHDRISGHPAR